MKLNIAVLPGDGIGPEVTYQALGVIRIICKKFGHELYDREAIIGAVAIDSVGDPYPESTHAICMNSDAILFGAIGHPKYDNDPMAVIRPEHGLLAMRKKLGLYANIRPITTFPSLINKSPLRSDLIDGADFICIRELTGGIYFGSPKGRSEDYTTAYDTCVYTTDEIERIIRLAYEYALKRKQRLTVVDKANVLSTSRLWRQVSKKLEKEKIYEKVKLEYMFVDNAAMQIIQSPKHFDVIVTENMFGDILTDEASVITGSLGMLPSVSMGIYTSVFEPIHGSYPQVAGKNIANPMAAILSSALMFEHAFDLHEEKKLIYEAVNACLYEGIVTEDIVCNRKKAYKTSEVGRWIMDYIEKNNSMG